MTTTVDDRTHLPREARTAPVPRPVVYAPRPRRWAGVLALCLITAGVVAYAVSSLYDTRSVGQKVDATVEATQQKVQDQVDDLKLSAATAARDGAQATDRVAAALNDAGITAAVKTSLAADPKLSALKIDVKTEAGVVSLSGPAPDAQSRERAEVLAAAPTGVVRVDNRLVVLPPAAATTR
jgi:osmotically-inducible protein OsmY